MAVTAILACACVCALLSVCGGENKDTGRAKKLRNVIITSFGELPYEPMESGGFYQSDVFPVNFEDEIKQQTMDVALRTRILVEDPNEKNDSDKTEDIPVENDAMSTFPIQHDRSSEKIKESDKLKKFDENVVSSRMNNNGYRQLRNIKRTSDQFEEPSRYESRQTTRQKPTKPPAADSNGFNINREYDGDLGAGWNLQDAEDILRGRNYNVLTQTLHSYPSPSSKEIPPPMFPPRARYPVFYPHPGINYSPFPQSSFVLHGRPARHSAGDIVYGKAVSRRQVQARRSELDRLQMADSEYRPSRNLMANNRYLSGI